MINVLFERPLRIRQHFKHRLTRSPNIWTEFLDDVRMDEPEGVTLTDLLRRHIALMIIARKKRRGDETNTKHWKLRGPSVIPMGQQAGQHLWLLLSGWLQVTEWQRSRVWPDTARSVRPLPSSSRLQQHGSCLETWDPAPSYSDESTVVIKYLAKPKNNWAIRDEYFPTLLWKQDGWLIVRLLADVGFIKLISFWRNFCYFREECWEITAKKNNRAKKCKIPLHVGLLPFKFYYPLKC